MLFNPGDTLSVAIITTGEPPKFRPSARIVGISKLTLEDEFRPNSSAWNRIIGVITTLATAWGYGLFTFFLVRPYTAGANRLLFFIATLTFCYCALRAIKYTFAAFDFEQNMYWQMGLITAVVTCTYAYLLYRFRRGQLVT
jgi:hypothetical protein